MRPLNTVNISGYNKLFEPYYVEHNLEKINDANLVHYLRGFKDSEGNIFLLEVYAEATADYQACTPVYEGVGTCQELLDEHVSLNNQHTIAKQCLTYGQFTVVVRFDIEEGIQVYIFDKQVPSDAFDSILTSCKQCKSRFAAFHIVEP